MKLILGLCGAVALAGLVDVIDTLKPGGPHLPQSVPVAVAVAVAAGLLALAVLLIGLRMGVRPNRPGGVVIPSWYRILSVFLLALSIALWREHDNLLLPFAGFWIAFGAAGQTLGLLRLRRSGPQMLTPPGPGTNWHTR